MLCKIIKTAKHAYRDGVDAQVNTGTKASCAAVCPASFSDKLNALSIFAPFPKHNNMACLNDSHLEQRNIYVRMLFLDYSSVFNPIVPSKLDIKLRELGLNKSLCNWISSFLTGWQQVVRLGPKCSSPLTISTRGPQGCVVSPLLYSLYTYDCVATHDSNFRRERRRSGNVNVSLNVEKTKELVIDYRKLARTHSALTINRTSVERISSFKFLRVHISEDISWSTHTGAVLKKYLQHLRSFSMNAVVLRLLYNSTIENIMAGNITCWFGNCTAFRRRALQRYERPRASLEGITKTSTPGGA